MEAHIKGHANDLPDDDNADEMMRDRSPSSGSHQQKETKHSILLNTPSTSSATPSPNNLVTHPAVTKYESEGSNLMNFAEQFSLINSASAGAPSTSTAISSGYPDTPKDSEASSEQNSDGDDVTYMNMYSRFEQSVVNQYGMNQGVNPALLAAASATLQPITPTSNATAANSCNPNLITLKPIQQQSSYENQARNNPNAYFGAAASNIQQSNDYK